MHLTKLASVQRVAWEMLEKQNLDPAAVFKTVQLNPDLMYQTGARYPLNKIVDLWDEMAKRIDDPCFGLTIATCWHPTYFGTLGYAMLVSKSLRITLQRLIRFHQVLSDADFGKLHEDKEAGTLVFTLTNIDETPYSLAREDAVFAWIMSKLRMNFRNDLAAVSVSLLHSQPECAARYYDFFKSPVKFDSPVSSLALSLEVVDYVLPGGNEELADLNDQIMTKYLNTLNKEDVLTRVRKIIVEHLPCGDATVDTIASELGYSSRNLQHLLQREGTTYMSLLNKTRMEIAKKYVLDGKIPLLEVTFLLGFAEQSSFSNSFRRWTGKSPTQYRQDHQVRQTNSSD